MVKENKKRKVNIRVILVIVAILIFLAGSYVIYRGSYLETFEIGEKYLSVYSQNLKYKHCIMIALFVIVFFAFYITTNNIKKGLKAFFKEDKIPMPKLPNKSISFIAGLIVSFFASDLLIEKTMLFFNSAWFGITDPVFNTDIGFYMFQLPFIKLCIIYLVVLIACLTAYIAVYYIIVFNKYFEGISGETLKKNIFIKQITKNIMLIVIGIASFIFINTQGIVVDEFLTLQDTNSTRIIGAGVTDVIIKKWGYRILSFVMVGSVFYAIKMFKERNTKKVILSLLTVPVYMVAMFLVMTISQLVFVKPNELDKQQKYIAYNLEYTQKAYGIDIEEVEVASPETIDAQGVENNKATINNIAVVNEDITLKTLNITQINTGYYIYNNIVPGKYYLNGKENMVYVSPRELDTSNRSYNNKTFEYTHGYGAIVTSANEISAENSIQYVQKDFEGVDNQIPVIQPRIYFGLQSDNTIVTNVNGKSEFDYPTTTSKNTEYTYNGNAGLKLNFLDRLIIGIKENNIKLALSSNINGDSKILTNRNIIKRAKTIMPYLVYDTEPYLVINDSGEFVWVLDAYTISNQYPYSQKSYFEYSGDKEQINYIRNSIKVIVDAYNGDIKFYLMDKSDPIAMAYNNTYKDLFVDASEIPEDVARHFVYPKLLYKTQANILKQYHDVTTDVLYRGDDVWDIATSAPSATVATKGVEMEPYYTMVKTANYSKQDLGLLIPYTPQNKQNLRAYLVGTSNLNEHGKLTLYKFSADSNVLGTLQLDNQICQDETISKQIDAITVSGTKLIKNLIVVPVDNTLLYVEPIYQQALNEANSIPVLKKVIVASGTKVAIGDTFKEAMANLLSQSAVQIEIENTDTIEGLIQEIIKANNNLDTSRATEDWEMIGKDIKKMQELIDKLEVLQEEEEKNKNEQENILK